VWVPMVLARVRRQSPRSRQNTWTAGMQQQARLKSRMAQKPAARYARHWAARSSETGRISSSSSSSHSPSPSVARPTPARAASREACDPGSTGKCAGSGANRRGAGGPGMTGPGGGARGASAAAPTGAAATGASPDAAALVSASSTGMSSWRLGAPPSTSCRPS